MLLLPLALVPQITVNEPTWRYSASKFMKSLSLSKVIVPFLHVPNCITQYVYNDITEASEPAFVLKAQKVLD